MFANAYGWSVVKHLVDTHFADTYEANTADVLETSEDKAEAGDGDFDQPTAEQEGGASSGDPTTTGIRRTNSEMREAIDSISVLRGPKESNSKSSSYSSKMPSLSRQDPVQWDDSLFDIIDESDEVGDEEEQGRRESSETPQLPLYSP